MLESLLKLLGGGQPGAVIWTADISYWVSSRPGEEIEDNGWNTEDGCLQLCRELRCMPYYWYDSFWAGELVPGPGVERVSDREGDSGITRWVTSKGSLTQVSQFAEISRSEAITKHAVTSVEDLRILLHILEKSSMRPANIDEYPSRMERWKDYDGLPALGMPRSPLPAFLVEWAGIQVSVHLDGTVRGLLPKLAAVGIDAIEALTPQPVGDLPVEAMRGVAGSDSVILWGGVPGAMFAPPYTRDDMKTYVLKVLKCWSGQPFVLGVADQVLPDGDISMVRKIGELCE